MGVTIHFEGRLRDPEAYRALLVKAERFAAERGWEFEPIEEQVKKLARVRDEEDWDYEGLVKGLALQPHPNSEPVRLEFDSDLYVQEYTKTQFAPIETHIEVVELLKQLEPFFEKLQVNDEGEYFETLDRDLLTEHFDRCFQVINELLAESDQYHGPFRMPDKRIIDAMKK